MPRAPTQKRLRRDVRRVLENPIEIERLKPNQVVKRLHDDHDGDCIGTVRVSIGQDGDVWIRTLSRNNGDVLRFRTPGAMGGGGMSPRTFNAIKILALAMYLDNQERPQQI